MIETESVRAFWAQLDFPQTAHLISAGLAYEFGKRGSPGERTIIWGAAALMWALLAWAGWTYGVYGWPMSYRCSAPEPFLFHPLPGVELRGVDHAVETALAGVFAAAALAGAWADGLFARVGEAFRDWRAAAS